MAVLALASSSPPDADSDGIELPIVSGEFDDERSVTVAVIRMPDGRILTGAAGVLTESTCVSGATLQSGDRLAVIDDAEIVFVDTRRPLWRDMRLGDTGSDVLALQESLSRAGESLAHTGVFDADTVTAWREVQSRAGVTAVEDEVRRDRIAFTTTDNGRVTACPTRPGDQSGPGSELASTQGSVEALDLQSSTSGWVDGPRALSVGQERVLLDSGETRVAAREEFGELLAAASVFTDETGLEYFDATVVLATPLNAVAVSPVAVAVASSDDARVCIATQTGIEEGTLLLERLGQIWALAPTLDEQAVAVPWPAGEPC